MCFTMTSISEGSQEIIMVSVDPEEVLCAGSGDTWFGAIG